MPKVTSAGAMRIYNHAINHGACAFITNFVANSDAHGGLTYQGMIFGEGNVILEYWAGAMMWHELRYRRFGNDDPELVAYILDSYRQEPALYAHYTAFCDYYQGEGANGMPARSNAYISFKQDKLLISGNYKIRGDDHWLTAKFNTRVPEQRFNFYRRFDNSAYGLRQTTATKFISGIEKDFPNSTEHIRESTKFNGSNVTSIRQFMVRRACKFLMYDIILEQRQKIHYALDGITNSIVASKRAIDIPGRDIAVPKVPVCTSELRELFRMWNFFRDHTKFYLNFEEIGPLWQTCPSEEKKVWAEYASKLATKTSLLHPADGQLAGAAQVVAELCLATAYDESINQYHALSWRLHANGIAKHPGLV